ncbi:MAG: hypothetical protein ABR611_07695 [Chthoniobacterales bacterium]
MTVDDIRNLLDDDSLDFLDVTRRLATWKGAVFELYLTDWTFEDFRPRDEWFSIHGRVSGRTRALRLFIQDGGHVDSQKKADLFEIGTRQELPPIRIRAVVHSDCSTLSTGLFLYLLEYSVDEHAPSTRSNVA